MYPASAEYVNNKESCQIEEVDFGSRDIYFFIPFYLLVSVYVNVSVCDFVSIAFLLSFVLGFCLSDFGVFLVYLFCFYYLKFFFLILIFYFNNFYILFYFIFFFLSFCPFILSRVEDRLLVLQPGVMAVALRWESQVQDTGT